MEAEIHIKSADLDVMDDDDDERGYTTQPPSAFNLTTSQPSHNNSLYKIYRKGDKIHQVLGENVTMTKDGPTTTTAPKTSFHEELDGPLDEVASGESLFKTFTFDNGISEEETEKCLNFWRSVVEKNLEPIKCSLIENAEKNRIKSIEINKNKEKSTKKKSKKKGNKPPTSADLPSSSLSDPSSSPQKSKSNQYWQEILNELKKKRLNETKLLLEKRCRFCGYVNSPSYETADDVKKQTETMIEDLQNWEPKSFKRKGSYIKKSLITNNYNEISVNNMHGESSEKSGIAAKTYESSVKEITAKDEKKSLIEAVKEQAKSLVYVDVIDERRKEGSYSKWRENKLGKCECKKSDCDCNIRGDIKHFDNTTVKEKSAISVPSKIPLTLKADKTDAELNKDKITSDDTLQMKKHELNDNEEEAVQISKEIIEMALIDAKIDPISIEETKVADAEENKLLEIYIEKSIVENKSVPSSTNQEEITHHHEFAGTNKSVHDEDISAAVENTTLQRKDLFSENIDEELMRMNSSSAMKRKSSIRRSVKKSISVLLNCKCSNINCDCTGLITLPEKQSVIKDEETDFLPPAPQRASREVHRVNSIELIKRRVSCSLSSENMNQMLRKSKEQSRKSLTSRPSIR